MKTKLSVAIAGEQAAPSAFVVWRGFEQSMRRAAAFGYHGVELALKTAGDIPRAELERLLSLTNLEVSAISTGQVFADLGLSFTHPDEQIRREAVRVFQELIALAADYGRLINIGRARGPVWPEQTRDEAKALFLETIRPLCEQAVRSGVRLVIEPVNRYEINFINSVDEGAALLDELGCGGVGLMPDVFHMNIEDDSIGGSLRRNARYVDYVHLADSNRLAPGWGHLDFGEVFAALDSIGYSGWCSVECLPKPDPDAAAKQAAEYILPRLI